MPRLDLSGLEAFNASALLEDATGKPLELSLSAIDFDPKQPRRHMLDETLTKLGETIKADGVLQPICVRPHPNEEGRYIINHGERRVRAARLAGLTTIPAFVREHVDPYAQAIENLQREDLLPLDLAVFIDEREQAGDSRVEIARRLGKPASFVTEVAELAQTPALIRKAHDEGRCRDVRALYLLVRTHREQPGAVEHLLSGNATVTREQVETLATEQGVVRAKPRARLGLPHTTSSESGSGNDLAVEVEGQAGILDVRRHPSKTTAEVRFADGSRHTVELARLRLIAWMES